jgi:hypothetical protein
VEWQEHPEGNGLKMCSKKAEGMACSKEGGEVVSITDRHGNNIKQVTQFKYLGLEIEETGSVEMTVKERITAA